MTETRAKRKLELRRWIDIVAILFFTGISLLISAGRGQGYDHRISAWLESQGHNRPWLDTCMYGLTHFGDTAAIILATLVFAILLTRLAQRRRPAFALLITLGIAFALNNAIKFLFQRARPQLSALIIDPTSYSYPSGHAMISAAVYGSTALLLGEVFPAKKWAFYLGATLLVAGIGVSRIYLDAHWPSDVLAGWAAGWVMISIGHLWYLRQPPPK